KAMIVAGDETEQGNRMLLNLGHTFGHALEALTRYDNTRLIHGEAVAIGIACAFRFSHELGYCSDHDVDRVIAHLQAVGLPTRIQDIVGLTPDPKAILESMYQDKKVQKGTLTFILASGIGKAFVARDVNPSQVLDFLVRDVSVDTA